MSSGVRIQTTAFDFSGRDLSPYRGDPLQNISNVAGTFGKFISIHIGNIRVSGWQVWSSAFYNAMQTREEQYNAGPEYIVGGSGFISYDPTKIATRTVNIAVPSIDLAYSFGYSVDKRSNRMLTKLIADGAVIYDILDASKTKFAVSLHTGLVREKDSLIEAYRGIKTCYFPDQAYVVIKGYGLSSYNAPLPKELIAEFTSVGSGSADEITVTKIKCDRAGAIYLPDFDNAFIYIYYPNDSLAEDADYGKIEKWDVTTETLLSTMPVVLPADPVNVYPHAPERQRRGKVLNNKGYLWFKKARLFVFQVFSDEYLYGDVVSSPLYAVDPETGEMVAKFGSWKTVDRGDPNTPNRPNMGIDYYDNESFGNPANGDMPTTTVAIMVEDQADKARALLYRMQSVYANDDPDDNTLTTIDFLYHLDIAGNANDGATISVTNVSKGDLGETQFDNANAVAPGVNGVCYFFALPGEATTDLYAFDTALRLFKSFQKSDRGNNPGKTVTQGSRVILLDEDRVQAIDSDGSTVYDKQPSTTLTGIGTATNHGINNDTRSLSYAFYPSVSAWGSVLLSDGSGTVYPLSADTRAIIDGSFPPSHYDGPRGRYWGLGRNSFFYHLNAGNGTLYLRDFMRALYVVSGKFTEDQIQFESIDNLILGGGVFAPSDLGQLIGDICTLYKIEKLEQDGNILFYRNRKGAAISVAATLTIGDLCAPTEGEDPGKALKIFNKSLEAQKSQIDLDFIDPDIGYTKNTVSWRRPDADIASTDSLKLAVPIVLQKSEALSLIQQIFNETQGALTGYDFRLPKRWNFLGQGDVVKIIDRKYVMIMRITEDTLNGDWSLSCLADGVVESEEIAVTIEVDTPPAGSGAYGSGKTRPFIFDIPALVAADNPTDPASFLTYELIAGTSPEWDSGYLARSENDQFGFMFLLGRTNAPIVLSATNALGDRRWEIDSTPLAVTSIYGTWDAANNVTRDELFRNASANLAIYGAPGRWEIVQFQSIVAGKVTGILRGMRGTDVFTGMHAAGDLFVPINNVIVKETRTAALGQIDKYRGVSISEEITEGLEIESTVERNSLKPWAPINLRAVRDPDTSDILITWNRRDRIGSDWFTADDLPNSEGLLKFAVTIEDSAGEDHRFEATESLEHYLLSDQTAMGNSNATVLTISVAQISAGGTDGFARKATVNVE